MREDAISTADVGLMKQQWADRTIELPKWQNGQFNHPIQRPKDVVEGE